MGSNFLECDRDEVLLLPPSLREWLPAGTWRFVIDAVERLAPDGVLWAYRLDEQSGAAHEPSVMVALCSTAKPVAGAVRRR